MITKVKHHNEPPRTIYGSTSSSSSALPPRNVPTAPHNAAHVTYHNYTIDTGGIAIKGELVVRGTAARFRDHVEQVRHGVNTYVFLHATCRKRHKKE